MKRGLDVGGYTVLRDDMVVENHRVLRLVVLRSEKSRSGVFHAVYCTFLTLMAYQALCEFNERATLQISFLHVAQLCGLQHFFIILSYTKIKGENRDWLLSKLTRAQINGSVCIYYRSVPRVFGCRLI